MAAVNAQIDRLHASLGLADSDFFCECGHSACKERIAISRAGYARLVEESRQVIASAHVDDPPRAASFTLATVQPQAG